jgi:hypothetical protein
MVILMKTEQDGGVLSDSWTGWPGMASLRQ